VERGQVRELQRLHDAAGVTAASDEVATGHHVVRQIATSGTPVPPAPPVSRPGGAASGTGSSAARPSGRTRRPGRPAGGQGRFAPGTANPSRRPRNARKAA
jgi:hypothetical protein